MRCPKCGYITFDHQETCSKCRKNIAATSEELSGTVFKAESPAFLKFEVHEPMPDSDGSIDLFQEDSGADVDFSLDEDEGFADNLQDDDIEFDFTGDKQDDPASQTDHDDGGVEFDMALFDADSPELVLDAGDEGDDGTAQDEDGPQLDFSELDISDLAPPAADEEVLSAAELTLEDTSAPSVTQTTGATQSTMGVGAELEDLQMNGLDLEMPSLPPAGSATGKKMRPAVKTGTALDGFDIDLGDLLSDQKK